MNSTRHDTASFELFLCFFFYLGTSYHKLKGTGKLSDFFKDFMLSF